MTAVDQEQTEAIRQLVPFADALGIEVIVSRPDEVRARVEWRPERCTTGDVLHGGVIMSLADTTGATCAFQNLPEGAAGTTTIESKTNFLRAVRDGYAEAVSVRCMQAAPWSSSRPTSPTPTDAPSPRSCRPRRSY